MFNSLFVLAKKEQDSNDGDFISTQKIEDYWDKLKEKAEFIVHLTEGQTAGFIAFYCNDEKKEESFITLVLISAEFRRKKIAVNLVNSVLSITKSRGFKRCSLEVKKSNQNAINLYQKLGFSITDERSLSFIMKRTV